MAGLSVTALNRSRHRLADPLGQTLLLVPVAAWLGYATCRSPLVAASVVALVLGFVVWTVRPTYLIAASVCVAVSVPTGITVMTAQLSVLRLCALVFVGLSAIHAIRLHRRLKLRPADYLAALLGGYFLLSGVLAGGPSPSTLFDGLAVIIFYFGMRMLTKAEIVFVLKVLVVAVAVASILLIVEFGHGSALFVNPADYLWNDSSGSLFRPGGVWGSPPAAGSVLSAAALLALTFARLSQRLTRALFVTAAALCLIGLILTFTRASWIGFGAGLVVLLALTASTKQRYASAAAAIVAAVVLSLTINDLAGSTTFYQGVIRPGNLAARESYWADALPIIQESTPSLIYGHGFQELLALHLDPVASVDNSLAGSPSLIRIGPHNQYVLLLLETGLIGLLLFAMWLLTVGSPVVRWLSSKSRSGRLTVLGPACAALSILVAFAAGDGLRLPAVAVMLGLLLGATTTLAIRASGERPLSRTNN